MHRPALGLLVASALLVTACKPSQGEDSGGGETGDEQDIVAGSSDRYACFTSKRPGCADGVGIGKSLEDAGECKEGVDYTITTSEDHPDLPLILTIHGGRIEFGTGEIGAYLTDALGWDHFTFTASPKSKSCEEARWMHVTSNRFNAAAAVDLAKRHPSAVTLHGYSEDNAEREWAHGDKLVICVGGLSSTKRTAFIRSMNKPAIQIEGKTVEAFDASKASDETSDTCGGLQGSGPTNVVNQPSGKGIQLEMPALLRAELAGTGGHQVNEKVRERLKTAIESAMK